MWKLSAVLAVALTIAACGGGETLPDDDAPASGIGPGISITEAIESELEGPLLVNGYLFVDAQEKVIFAESIAESFPPQPGGSTLEIEGLDLSEIQGLESAEGVSWTESPIQLLGTVQGEKLIISGESSA